MNNNKKTVKAKRITKAEKYAKFGLIYKKGKIYCPELDITVPLMLRPGTRKVGKKVAHFSTPAGTNDADNATFIAVYDKLYAKLTPEQASENMRGTCPMNCKDCYGKCGKYKCDSVKQGLAMRALIARMATEWLKKVITAQIIVDGITAVRIHCTGDFFSEEYAAMWVDIAEACPWVIFWTYTKAGYENIKRLNSCPNVNVVPSIVNGRFNFGTCGEIMTLYHELKNAGKDAYICRCGVGGNDHCETCFRCFSSDNVLFLKHDAPDYNAKKDPLYTDFCNLVNSQPEPDYKTILNYFATKKH